MGDFNPDSESASGIRLQLAGGARLLGRWLPRIGPALIALTASCADPDFARLSPEPQGRARPAPSVAAKAASADDFVQLVVKDMDAVWAHDFARRGQTYIPAGPSLLSETDCAPTPDAKCPPAPIDLPFQHSLQLRFGGSSRAPQAYAIAHQMGHHVQHVMGVDAKVAELLAERPIAAYMVETQVELQADCLAGVWLRSTPQRELLPPVEVERALRQASELGKELRIAKTAAKPTRESFTYAIPRRRGYWFYQGFASGRIEDCDTFKPE